MTEAASLLRAEGLVRRFADGGGVHGVSLSIARGEALGLVGGSGSGKSTLARLLLRLIPADAGRVWFDGAEITHLSGRRLLPMRRASGLVLQNPLGALDPRLTVGDSIAEPLLVHGAGDAGFRRDRVVELLAMVGLEQGHAARRPDALSGGQLQRVGIARALALAPRLLVLDEPVAALDVSVQAQIVNLLSDLRDRLGLACLFIAHDLAVVRQIADRVVVLQSGRIVEQSDAASLFAAPQAAATRALLAAAPAALPPAPRLAMWRQAVAERSAEQGNAGSGNARA
jgi:oligopeptide transport system ATP-binding protein